MNQKKLIEKIDAIFAEKLQECEKVTNDNGTVIIVYEPWLDLIKSQVIEAINESTDPNI